MISLSFFCLHGGAPAFELSTSSHPTDQNVSTRRFNGLSTRTFTLVFFWCNRAIDNARESHTEVDADSIIHDIVYRLSEIGIVEIGQESERSESEW
jgi:hypothetical protein